MDDELLELQRQFEFAQQAKSSIRLSDRNVVELVQKLQQLQLIDFELLHTASGKEYITLDQLRNEMVAEVKKLGRISVIDLADVTGVDLYYVEKLAQSIVTDHEELMLNQGEIITESYWDSIAEEINERLQECSQIALTELAAQLNVGLDLIASILEPRLGTIVKGRLEGGQLYTPAYVARVSAMVRGAARGITVPTNLTVLWSSLQNLLQEMDGASGVAVDGSFFQSLFNGLVKGGEILGSVRAGVHWTPAVFAVAQKESVDSFFSQNSFINYDVLLKLGIPQPIQFLQSRYPEGKPLVTTFVHPSMIEMLDAATEDALERGSWSDSLSLLPSSFTPQDASKMLSLCQSVQLALKSNKAHIFGDFYVLSSSFMKDICDRMVKELETLTVSRSLGTAKPGDLPIANEVKAGYDSSRLSESSDMASDSGSNKHADKGPKKKRGKATGNTLANPSESGPDNQEHTSTKSKKGQRRGKDTSSQTSDSKPGSRKESLKMKEDNLSNPSEEWIMEKITALIPDFEEQGIDDSETILRPLANKLRPTIISTWMEKKKALFKDNAERMKQLLDSLQKKLDESFLNMQLYEKALELFEDDQSTSVVLHRHLLRTVAAPMVDMLLHDLDEHNKLKNGVDVQESPKSESISFGPGERAAISKSFPGALANKALAVVEALEGKSVETFMSAFRSVTEESGLPLKKLDKKLERTILHSYRKELTSQVSAETDPVSLLPKVVSLLYVQVHHKALQAPGRAISVAISHLQDKLDESACKTLADYQTATVTLLALLSAAPDDEDSCASDRVLSTRELLESKMPALKSLVLTTSQS
ncbi:putative E3 UFM1-protein ligase 1 [Medicago truncatula]|uniref:Putative E3 UFM1-protein ligase 1 n=1 Tax=Medicago truncatula TaxID=3880 RepID=A0A396I7Z3_MEDTR|nr:E3 UFM1-protein ligase 1 homolog [Medicago truncatula]RHN60871.1 putative E3 UFM1-protein ligase 1 [Medicago truncatula]